MREMSTLWTLRKPLSSARDLRNLCRSTSLKFVSPTPPPCHQQKHRYALDGGPHTAFAPHFPKRMTQISRLQEAKKNRLTRFPTLCTSRTYNIPVPDIFWPPNTTNSSAKESPNLSITPRRENRIPKPTRRIPQSLTTTTPPEKTTKFRAKTEKFH